MYVVRVVDDVEAGDDELRGILRRVSDGAEWAFHGGEQLVELLHPDPESRLRVESDRRDGGSSGGGSGGTGVLR